MGERPYHHGDLREALLLKAEETLRASGVDALSLRELARAVGVSHAAPRRHFDDKADLLKALVAKGFQQLGQSLAEAARPDGDFTDRLRRVAVSYVEFATVNPALVDLMSSSAYLSDAPDDLVAARESSFVPVVELIADGQSAGAVVCGDVRQISAMLLATLHGVATMANNGMMDRPGADAVVAAVDMLMAGLTPRVSVGR